MYVIMKYITLQAFCIITENTFCVLLVVYKRWLLMKIGQSKSSRCFHFKATNTTVIYREKRFDTILLQTSSLNFDNMMVTHIYTIIYQEFFSLRIKKRKMTLTVIHFLNILYCRYHLVLMFRFPYPIIFYCLSPNHDPLLACLPCLPCHP